MKEKCLLFFLLLNLINCESLVDFSEIDWPDKCLGGLRNSPVDFPPENASNYILSNDYIQIISSSYEIIQGKSFASDNWKFHMNLEKSGGIMIKKAEITYSYLLNDIHFHISSSHTFLGSSYDLEFHLVHTKDEEYLRDQGVFTDPDADNKILIIAVLFRVQGDYLNLDIQKMNIATLAPINELDLKPYVSSSKNFYHYVGSRTVPPCEDNVNWIVMTQIESLSATQFEDFRNWVFQTYPSGNTRVTKPLYGRSIYHVKNSSSSFLTFTFLFVLIINSLLF